MAAEIINLRKARKARDRVEKEKRAEENRIKFGRTKAEREKALAEEAIKLRRLDAHERVLPILPEAGVLPEAGEEKEEILPEADPKQDGVDGDPGADGEHRS